MSVQHPGAAPFHVLYLEEEGTRDVNPFDPRSPGFRRSLDFAIRDRGRDIRQTLQKLKKSDPV